MLIVLPKDISEYWIYIVHCTGKQEERPWVERGEYFVSLGCQRWWYISAHYTEAGQDLEVMRGQRERCENLFVCGGSGVASSSEHV